MVAAISLTMEFLTAYGEDSPDCRLAQASLCGDASHGLAGLLQGDDLLDQFRLVAELRAGARAALKLLGEFADLAWCAGQCQTEVNQVSGSGV